MTLQIGENIKRLRKSKGITQEQLATAMNVTCVAVSKWERGDSYPDITLLMPLAYFFGISIDELMNYDEEKIEREIESILEEYLSLIRYDSSKARKLITEAYKKYPNDYRIMCRYIWNIPGGLSCSDKALLLSRKEEFTVICERILEGCKENGIRLKAYHMLGKLMWAEGRSDEALELYNKSFSHWHETAEERSEQLFEKGSSEFMYWVKKNTYELTALAADKLPRCIFFDSSIDYKEKVQQIEKYGDKITEVYRETGVIIFLVLAAYINRRLTDDLHFHGGTEEDIIRIRRKFELLKCEMETAAKGDKALNDAGIWKILR